MRRVRSLRAAFLLLACPAPLAAQHAAPAIVAAELRARLEAIAHDSMGGRATGSRGNALTADLVAAEFRRAGLEPGGDSGTFFQAVEVRRATPLEYPARNVIGIVRGADPALRHTYVAVSAHNDHLGTRRTAVEHDSLRAFNRAVRPLGADSRLRPAMPEEAAIVRVLLDSLRAARPARADSIYNGADDDGSGTVALIAIARSLMTGPRPRRSVLLVSHAAEEVGLLGSRWYSEHTTVPRDSLVGEIDVDMIGRGGAHDLPGGGPGYIEVVGSTRLSTEFGALLEAVNARLAEPFVFNYEYDAPGHPAQYYCRADHYSYARFGIPSVSLSTGLHLDYHQLTDEPQYIDYAKLARVATLTRDLALAVANLDHRPVVDGPRADPGTPCRQ
jgi:hypothetical protein